MDAPSSNGVNGGGPKWPWFVGVAAAVLTITVAALMWGIQNYLQWQQDQNVQLWEELRHESRYLREQNRERAQETAYLRGVLDSSNRRP